METLYNNQFCYPASLYLTIAFNSGGRKGHLCPAAGDALRDAARSVSIRVRRGGVQLAVSERGGRAAGRQPKS